MRQPLDMPFYNPAAIRTRLFLPAKSAALAVGTREVDMAISPAHITALPRQLALEVGREALRAVACQTRLAFAASASA